jgi:RNA polymerase sigma factor (TIGR02999 family)
MGPDRSTQITGLLRAWRSGDQAALDLLAAKVYDELRRVARRYMRNERAGNTLQTTALVNEVYLRLVDVQNVGWEHRAQFFAISAQMMRRILVDAARARGSHKRGGGVVKINVDDTAVLSPERDSSILALHDALEALSQIAPRQAKVVELRYFGGLNVDEIVEVLKVSPRTVERDWEFARAWLMRELGR